MTKSNTYKTPYNFVPLNKQVFIPDWPKEISHDAPLPGAVSGTIDFTFEARSPIFTRDGSQESGEGQTSEFMNVEGRYFLPGSSLKGMLRSVLEVLAFGKVKFVEDDRYAVRDLRSADYTGFLHKGVECGYLKKTADGEYRLYSHGTPGRIDHKDISSSFNAYFSRGGDFKSNKSEHKSAEHKYSKFGKDIEKHTKFEYLREDRGRSIYEPTNGEAGKPGEVIVTGQPSPNDLTNKAGKRTSKHFEFIFFDKCEKEYEVDTKVIRDFKFAYFNHEPESQQSKDWIWRNRQLESGEKIPVFFAIRDGELHSLGLAYMYKLPYPKSVYDGITPAHLTNDLEWDLVERIFGDVGDDKENLKGRVLLRHAFAEGSPTVLPEVENILSSPKASFYPHYLTAGDYFQNQIEIAGRKRYPVHPKDGDIVFHQGEMLTKDSKKNEKIGTSFKALDTGAVFKGTLSFHNLYPVELGAILSALTFHANDDICFHSFGMAKPLGYGKLKLSSYQLNVKDSERNNPLSLMATFEKQMCEFYDKWLESEQLVSLFTMAIPQENKESLRYLELAEHKDKKGGNGLPRYPQLSDVDAPKKVKSLSKYDAYELPIGLKDKKITAEKEMGKMELKAEAAFKEQKNKLKERHEALRKALDVDIRAAFNSKKRSLKAQNKDFPEAIGTNSRWDNFSGAVGNHLVNLDKLPENQREDFKKALFSYWGNCNRAERTKWSSPKKAKYWIEKLIEWVGDEDLVYEWLKERWNGKYDKK